MAELVYAHVSEACGAILGGSSPLMPTDKEKTAAPSCGFFFRWIGCEAGDFVHKLSETVDNCGDTVYKRQTLMVHKGSVMLSLW